MPSWSCRAVAAVPVTFSRSETMIFGEQPPPAAPSRTDRRSLLKATAGLLAAGAGAMAAGSYRGGIGAMMTSPAAANAAKSSMDLARHRQVGFMLAHEQFAAPQLTKIGAAAVQAGFGLLATSDHFQPWQANQAHVGEAWVTLTRSAGSRALRGSEPQSPVRSCATTRSSSRRRLRRWPSSTLVAYFSGSARARR